MKELNQYNIPFTGLKLGHHRYEFEVNDLFFTYFENSEITNGNFKVEALLEKQSTLMILDLIFNGKINVDCDRCGDLLDLELNFAEKFIVKFASSDEDDADEIIVLDPKEHQLSLGEKIFETITLHFPLKRTHEEGKCNEETLKNLEKYKPTENKNENDPRWDMLKNIKFN